MKKYDNYKDSGLEWLGMVPEHWKIDKLKYQFGLVTTPSESSNKIGLENIESATGRFIKTDSDFEGNGIAFLPNDIVYGKLRPYLQKVWLAEFSGSAVGDFYVFRCNKGTYPVYVKYLLLSHNFTVEADGFTYGAKMPRVSYEFVANLKWAMPPLIEQRAIASYLDHKVGKIDALISEKEKMVEDLKAYRSSLITETVTKGLDKGVEMKDSGVEWIGKIPSDWTISKFKYICKINGRIGFRGYTTDDLVSEGNGAFTIGGKHISKNLLDLSSPEYISWEKYYESPEIMVKKGDIISAQRGTLGRTAYIDKEIGPATINPSLVLINDIIEDAKFLYWFMVSNSFLSMIEFVNTATAVPMISQTQFGNTRIPLPPISEQHIIVEYLEKEISKIDTSISELEHQLSDLKSYKSSLITEAVTGKIDLRDWQTKKS